MYDAGALIGGKRIPELVGNTVAQLRVAFSDACHKGMNVRIPNGGEEALQLLHYRTGPRIADTALLIAANRNEYQKTTNLRRDHGLGCTGIKR